MKTSRLRPVLYRRNARGEEFLQLPRGFWAPLAWLLGAPHLAQAARTLLQAGLPRRFAVRCDCLGHARDASARLLPLVLYRDALDLAPLVRRCADPEALGAYVRGRLAEFSPGEAAAERQVLVCQALPDLCEASAALQPVPPVACPLPVLVQHRARPALNAGAIEALESTAGPVVVLLAAGAPAPDGWLVVEVPDAPDSWYGELLFQLFDRGPADRMERREARIAAKELLRRRGRLLTEQDFALAADYVHRCQGPAAHTNAACFLQLAGRIPRDALPCCPDVPDTDFFRRWQLQDDLELASPATAVGVWKRRARRAPRPYPHGEAAELPPGLPAGRRVCNRMHYAPPPELGLHAPCTLLVAEGLDGGEAFYGRRPHDVHGYAQLAEAAVSLADRRPGVCCWALVADCAPEDLQAVHLRRAPYAFCVEEQTLTLYDGPEGLRAFAEAAGTLMTRQLRQ